MGSVFRGVIETTLSCKPHEKSIQMVDTDNSILGVYIALVGQSLFLEFLKD
jgi:hypothetical protein